MRYKHHAHIRGYHGFTLLELLIVIAIIAILSAILIFILNPAETLRKSRDSQRMSDLNTLERAIALNVTNVSIAGGTIDPDGPNFTFSCFWENVASGDWRLFVSVPSDNGEATPTTFTTWSNVSWQRQPNAIGTAIDGSGWMPQNLSQSGNSPISNLPRDPVNRFDRNLYYLYVCKRNGTFELQANLESVQFSQGGVDDKESTDGGDAPALLEHGTILTVSPFPDADGDAWSDTAEATFGTDPSSACPADSIANNEAVDAWPPDLNDDRRVDLSDLLIMVSSANTKCGDAGYLARRDLTRDCIIDSANDVEIILSAFGVFCP